MEKLPMCRVCLAEKVRMHVVVNRNLHKLYEKLTDIPFVTEDSRPILACFFCCTKLKQCYRLLRQCLEAEELFAQMMNEDYEPTSLINQHQEFLSGLIKSPMEHISILVDECQTEYISIKEELPAHCDIIEPKEEHQSDELEPGNVDNSCLDVADTQPHHSESDVEDNVPIMEFKTEVEEEEVSKKKRRASKTKRATVVEKPKLGTRRIKQGDAITAEQIKEDNLDSKIIRTTQKQTSNSATYLKEPYKWSKKQQQHSCTIIGEKPFKCDVCQRSFSKMGNLSQHIRIHTGEKPFKCDICQRSFSHNSNLSKHIRIHTGENLYTCVVCQRSFRQKWNLTRHIRIHDGLTLEKCNIYQRSFSRNSDLSTHIRIHTGVNPYKCVICQRSFNRKSNLTSHLRIHTGEKPFKCDVCHRGFNRKCDLLPHIRIHTGENPYKCDICQRSFRQMCNLTRHIRIHDIDKPFNCNVCHRGFSQKSYLSTHIRIHTGENPYKCVVCQCSFSQKSNLTRHIRIHTGEKPEKCNVRQSSFSQKGD